jgi:RNA polymerase sigma-70 factor (ECF subfamily)
MDDTSEPALIHDMHADHAGAFEALVRRYAGRILRAVMRITRDPVDAADVVQEALLAAYEHRHRFRGQSSFGTWLHRIAINCAIARRRRGARLTLAGDDDLAAHPAGESPEEPLLRSEIRAALQSALDDLPAVDRLIVWMKDVEDEAHEAIARRTGLTVSASRVRLHRARAALRSRLAGAAA